MSRIDECENPDCKRPFYVSEIGAGKPGASESEEICCPHCRWSKTERSSGVFQTSPLSKEVEEDYNKNK